MIDTVLMILACVAFLLAIAKDLGVNTGRINWIAVGLLLWALTALV